MADDVEFQRFVVAGVAQLSDQLIVQTADLVDEVEEELFRRSDREVQSIDIGRAIALRLKQIDHIAYVRFASVYKQFRDLDDLLDEVREVLESAPPNDPPEQGKLF